MPVFDIVGFMKIAARFLILVGIVAYVVGFSYIMAVTAHEVATILNFNIIKLNSLLSGGSGGGGNTVSCFFTIFYDLGFTVAFNSFLSSLMGLLLLYSGILIELLVIKFGLFLKGLLLTGTK